LEGEHTKSWLLDKGNVTQRTAQIVRKNLAAGLPKNPLQYLRRTPSECFWRALAENKFRKRLKEDFRMNLAAF
jgi:hypothetical protein